MEYDTGGTLSVEDREENSIGAVIHPHAASLSQNGYPPQKRQAHKEEGAEDEKRGGSKDYRPNHGEGRSFAQ